MVTQVLSLIGSGMTSIAVGIQVFRLTGDTTPVLLAGVFTALPMMLAGSFAGVLVDRWERRKVLVWCDIGQALGTLLLLASFFSGTFELWHLYTVACLQGTLGMFQRPAMEATIALLVPPAHLDRANVIRQVAGPTAGMIAPMLAGVLYAISGIAGVMLVDLATFAVAVGVVVRIAIPQPQKPLQTAGQTSAWRAYGEGLVFLWQRRTLLYLMIYAAVLNFLLAGPISLTTPYLLTLTRSEQMLGLLLGIMNAGIVVGGIVMGIWGGTRPRIHGIMLGLLFRACGLAIYGVARTPLTLGLALFFIFL
jgi:MFS family permease